MHRSVPISGKKRKEKLKLKRAVKRGDVPAPEPQRPQRHRKGGALANIPATPEQAAARAAAKAARKLQSAFVKVSPEFLEETKMIAATEPLPRPLDAAAAVFPAELAKLEIAEKGETTAELTCPARPKWRFDMSKKEVEKNEEGVYQKWLAQMDALVETWRAPPLPPAPLLEDEEGQTKDPDGPPPPPPIPKAPTHFERNLEVWRQLWRVSEISQILLVLLDARCPALHFPPSLAAHLAGRPVILVLTKVDIAGPARAAAWTAHLRTLHPGLRIVQVEAYIPKETASRQGGAHAPHIPLPFRRQLVDALKEVHREMLQPPEHIRADAKKLKNWRPPVRREVDWEAVVTARGGQVGSVVGGASVPRPKEEGVEGQEAASAETEPEYLTIGLIGQPNVGKSSLLNALFGTTKVRASRTPGKTKHFQTLFWTNDVRLVDCPGLIMPNFIPMEMQVLSGTLPISRVSAVPACIHFASRLLPLERILKLTHPSAAEAPVQDKRTWREGTRHVEEKSRDLPWTAMDILTAYANLKGWVTAKAGRPDINRSGNAILRALAEGRIRWAFWPPGTDPQATGEEVGNGIWIPIEGALGGVASEVDSDGREDDAEESTSSEEGEADDSAEEAESEDEKVARTSTRPGRFAALSLEEGHAQEDRSEEEESESEDEESESE